LVLSIEGDRRLHVVNNTTAAEILGEPGCADERHLRGVGYGRSGTGRPAKKREIG
jgi:hypothetical protein